VVIAMSIHSAAFRDIDAENARFRQRRQHEKFNVNRMRCSADQRP
jgi:hypothetical protein